MPPVKSLHLALFFNKALARDCHFTGFPVFEQFYFRSFLRSTQINLSLLCLPVPPRSRLINLYIVFLKPSRQFDFFIYRSTY